MSDMRGACYKCKHRGTVPGDAHSCCRHPELNELHNDPLSVLLSMLGKRMEERSLIPKGWEIEGDQHGIRSGWFIWPINFDPVWLIKCNKVEYKDTGGSSSG